MDRVFLDANVLYSIAYDRSAKIARILDLPDSQLTTSPYAAVEALRNLDAKSPDKLPILLDLLKDIDLTTAVLLAPLPAGVILPADDEPILRAAITIRATHLLTGDKDFRRYFGRVIEGVLILRPGDYLRLRERD